MINLLITSPSGYAQRLLKAFEDDEKKQNFLLGDSPCFHPVSQPMILTEVAIGTPQFRDFVHQLASYDYLAFSSRKSIEAFALGLQKEKVQLPATVRLCAIGKDNEMLREALQVEPAFVSNEPSPMGIVRHLATEVPDSKGKQIAVLAPQVVGMTEPPIVPDFIHGLEQIGMYPHRVNVYQTQAASRETLVATASQILHDDYDAVVFTSGTEIKVFLQMIPETMSVDAFLQHLTVICYGPYTARCAADYGVKVDFVSPAYGSFQELVSEIRKYYQTRTVHP